MSVLCFIAKSTKVSIYYQGIMWCSMIAANILTDTETVEFVLLFYMNQ